MPRSPSDVCLLCKFYHATKKNSHIVPKFIGKSILGKDRRSGIIDSSQPFKKIQIKQDSPKENFILCPGCEKYFEVLETYGAEHFFKRISNNFFNRDFIPNINEGGVHYLISEAVDTKIFRLLILSIFWRCSVSSVQPFTKFRIQEVEIFRRLLLSYKTHDLNSLSNFNNTEQDVLNLPLTILRATYISNPEYHFYYANSINGKVYQLFLNEYILFISSDIYPQIAAFGFLSNIGIEKLKIGLLSDSIWKELIFGVHDLIEKKCRK